MDLETIALVCWTAGVGDPASERKAEEEEKEEEEEAKERNHFKTRSPAWPRPICTELQQT